MTNDKLPDEIIEQIKKEAQAFTIKGDESPYCSYEAGATAWAHWKVKYDELSAENSVLRQKNIQIESRLSVCEKEVYDNRSERVQLLTQAHRMADALEAIGNGCATPQYIANKALQQFKDGTKEVENG